MKVPEDEGAPEIRATGLVSSTTVMLVCDRSNPSWPETVSVMVFSPGVPHDDEAVIPTASTSLMASPSLFESTDASKSHTYCSICWRLFGDDEASKFNGALSTTD